MGRKPAAGGHDVNGLEAVNSVGIVGGAEGLRLTKVVFFFDILQGGNLIIK